MAVPWTLAIAHCFELGCSKVAMKEESRKVLVGTLMCKTINMQQLWPNNVCIGCMETLSKTYEGNINWKNNQCN